MRCVCLRARVPTPGLLRGNRSQATLVDALCIRLDKGDADGCDDNDDANGSSSEGPDALQGAGPSGTPESSRDLDSVSHRDGGSGTDTAPSAPKGFGKGRNRGATGTVDPALVAFAAEWTSSRARPSGTRRPFHRDIDAVARQ